MGSVQADQFRGQKYAQVEGGGGGNERGREGGRELQGGRESERELRHG